MPSGLEGGTAHLAPQVYGLGASSRCTHSSDCRSSPTHPRPVTTLQTRSLKRQGDPQPCDTISTKDLNVARTYRFLKYGNGSICLFSRYTLAGSSESKNYLALEMLHQASCS